VNAGGRFEAYIPERVFAILKISSADVRQLAQDRGAFRAPEIVGVAHFNQ
jgi:hypothetical protein